MEEYAVDIIEQMLGDRECTHGDFNKNAEIWLALTNLTKDARFKTAAQAMALNMIFVKISRVLQNPNVEDHWNDIAGYARLGARGCD